MPLILAIEPDKRQSSQLASVVKGLHAELVLRTNAAEALAALNGRVPDLVLTTSLISPRDDAALATHLRELGFAGAHVQTVTIPLLGSAAPTRARGGMLAALRREKPPAPMTDGCDPAVFAEQVRQYLATAEEQKATAATRAVVIETVAEPVLVEDAATEAAFANEFRTPAEEFLTPVVEPEPASFEPEPEPVLVEAAPVLADVPTPETEPAAVEPEPTYETPFYAAPVEEPIADPIEAPPVVAEIEMEAAASEELVADEPESVPLSQLLEFVSAARPAIEEPVAAAPIPEPVIEPEPASAFGDLYVDPVAAAALDELSRQAPVTSLSDGIPAEAPVPVVEMRSFQSLDTIASELAAGPAHRHESLDDLASLFAAAPATPAPVAPAADCSAPMHGAKSLFASLFAEPAPARPSKPIDIPGIDPSLFASPALEPAIAFEVPAPVMAVESEPVLAIHPEPILAAPAPILAAEPEPEPILIAAVQPAVSEVTAAPAVEAVEEVVVGETPVAVAAVEAMDDELVAFEPVVFEPVVEETAVVASAPGFDEEIALDVDAFTFTPPAPAAPAEPQRFSFTLVDGFGDVLSDFEVPSIASVAVDLGVGEHAPLDPYASKPAPAPSAVPEALNQPPAAPALDEEALSSIGDAARKMSLDAFVVEEFERGLTQQRPKKLKKKVHAGATQVPAAPAPAAKPAKRPVQDEWGMFDPEQCGFAALDEEEGSETRPTTGTRVRVISY